MQHEPQGLFILNLPSQNSLTNKVKHSNVAVDHFAYEII